LAERANSGSIMNFGAAADRDGRDERLPIMEASLRRDMRSLHPKSPLTRSGEGASISRQCSHEIVCAQGDASDTVFYIHHGQVRLTVVSEGGKEAMIGLLGRGDFFGEPCLIGHSRHTVTVTTMTECLMSLVEKATMIRLIREDPKISEMFTSYLLRRSARIQDDLVDQLFNSCEKRLARNLLLLADLGRGVAAEGNIPAISQAMLAEMVGTTRSRISHFMNKFRRLGFIDYDGEIKVHSSLWDVVLADCGVASQAAFGNGANVRHQ
jgi:CRP/FNR family transcriptional regulator, cyclic AMP receptor protein